MKKILLLLGLCAALSACVSPQKIPPVSQTPAHQVFVWQDLASIDLYRTQRFYGNLFGWDLRQLNSTYSLFEQDGQAVGGMIHAFKTNPGQQNSVWLCTVKVENLDATLKRITDHGGSILRAPEQVPDRGSMAIFADPQDAILAIVQAPPSDGSETSTDWIWHELITEDAAGAADWYQKVFDLQTEKSEDGKRYLLKKNDLLIASISGNPFEKTRNQWIPVLAVEDFDQAVSKVVTYGGELVLPPSEDMNHGQLALLLDPNNAPLAIQKKGAAK